MTSPKILVQNGIDMASVRRLACTILTVSLALSLCAMLLINSLPQKGKTVPTLSLVKPAFAQAAGSSITFLDEEAGISLYADMKQPIDLAKAKSAFRVIEMENPDYIVGSVSLPNLPESDDVHCFVHKSGWIVIYYLKDEPTSKIIDWQYYAGKLLKNKLQTGMEKVCTALGVTTSDTKYYHFQYPQANKLLIIIDSQTGLGEDSFTYQIPDECTVYEGSWSHYACSGSNVRSNCGKLQTPKLKYNTAHTVKIGTSQIWTGQGYSYIFVDGEQISSFDFGSAVDYSSVAILMIYYQP